MPTITYKENTKRHDAIIRLTVILAHLFGFAILAIVFWTSGEIDWMPVFILAGSALLWVLIGLGTDHGAPKTLTLDDTGLTFARRSTGRHWNWAEISKAETLGSPRNVPYIRIRVDGIIDWKARVALTESLSKSEIRFHEIYDAPLRDICDTLNEYRDRALCNRVSGGTQSTSTGRDQP